MAEYMDRVEKLMQGSIDMHVHPDPSIMIRSVDCWEVLEQAGSAGMRGVLAKDHHWPTIMSAYLCNKHANRQGAELFGSICLNNSVGGLNPYALDFAIKMGARLCYFPTVSERQHIALMSRSSHGSRPEEFVPTRVAPMTEEPIDMFDEKGELKDIVKRLINMIADADIIFASGHCDYEETYALTKYAVRAGCRRILLTHLPLFTTEDKKLLQRIMDLGEDVIAELNIQLITEIMPPEARYTPEKLAEFIRFFGVNRTVMSTDFGQIKNPAPVEGMRYLIRVLIEQGFTDDEITMMINILPRKLLGIKD